MIGSENRPRTIGTLTPLQITISEFSRLKTSTPALDSFVCPSITRGPLAEVHHFRIWRLATQAPRARERDSRERRDPHSTRGAHFGKRLRRRAQERTGIGVAELARLHGFHEVAADFALEIAKNLAAELRVRDGPHRFEFELDMAASRPS